MADPMCKTCGSYEQTENRLEGRSAITLWNCDLCEEYFCNECEGITSTEARCLDLKKRVLMFYCQSCRISLLQSIPKLQGSVDSLKNDMKNMKMDNNSNLLAQIAKDIKAMKETHARQQEDMNKLGDIRTELQAIKTKIEAQPTRNDYDELKVTVCEMKTQIKHLQEDKRPVYSDEGDIADEVEERLNRAPNVILFGMEETSSTNESEDEEKIHGILNSLNLKNYTFKTVRLGKYQVDRNRPIKIMLPNKQAAREVLIASKRLPSNLKIRNDQTPGQRDQLQMLRVALQARVEGGEDNLTIKYIQGKPRIIKVAPYSVRVGKPEEPRISNRKSKIDIMSFF